MWPISLALSASVARRNPDYSSELVGGDYPSCEEWTVRPTLLLCQDSIKDRVFTQFYALIRRRKPLAGTTHVAYNCCANRSVTHDPKAVYSFDLWLRYKSKAVDLACLNQACKVNVIRKDGSSRARGEDTHRSAILMASHRRSLDARNDGEQGRKGLSSLQVRPLPLLLAFFALGNLAAASIPGRRRARFVGRGVELGAVAAYAWMAV
jgi:hypothetical protein